MNYTILHWTHGQIRHKSMSWARHPSYRSNRYDSKQCTTCDNLPQCPNQFHLQTLAHESHRCILIFHLKLAGTVAEYRAKIKMIFSPRQKHTRTRPSFRRCAIYSEYSHRKSCRISCGWEAKYRGSLHNTYEKLRP